MKEEQLCDVVITVSYVAGPTDAPYAGSIVTRLDLDVANCIADIEDFIAYVTAYYKVVHSERLGSIDNLKGEEE